jgi:hypothetical protein
VEAGILPLLLKEKFQKTKTLHNLNNEDSAASLHMAGLITPSCLPGR